MWSYAIPVIIEICGLYHKNLDLKSKGELKYSSPSIIINGASEILTDNSNPLIDDPTK